MRERWLDLKEALRRMFSTTWPDEPDTTTPDQIARWVEQHRHPTDGG